jgi:hypothetical protein
MKTNKHQTLLLVRQRHAIHSRDLVQQVGYSRGTRDRICPIWDGKV